MKRNAITRRLAEYKPTLAQQFGVTDLALFGSSARDSAGPGSDIDILVAFDGPRPRNAISACCFILRTTSDAPSIW